MPCRRCENWLTAGEVALVSHSQDRHFVWQLALVRPERIRAVYVTEPSLTAPDLADPAFPDIPVCIVWGDNLPGTASTLSRFDLSEF